MSKLPGLEQLALGRRQLALLGLVLGAWVWLPAPLVAEPPPARVACDPAFVQAYRELLALELGAHVEHSARLTLDCDASSAHVRLTRGPHVFERSVPLTTTDAARWLALAAGELLDAPPPSVASEHRLQQAPAESPAAVHGRVWLLYTAARVRLGDRPSTLRAGLELGGVAVLRTWLALEFALRFTSGARAGLGPVRVRAFDGGGALFVHHTYARERFRVLTGIGWTLGYTVLQAKSEDVTVAARNVQAAFTGPALALRAIALALPRVAVLGGLEAAYLRPRIDGRDEHGDTVFRQLTRSIACTLGLSVPL
jgi:hypothetical protein